MNVWGEELPEELLSDADRAFLSRFVSTPRPALEEIWRQLDLVWTEMGMDQEITPASLARYYSHPVWLVNGLFTAADPQSAAHRRAIANWLAGRNVQRVADYGGGFGQLAREIVRAADRIRVDVVEPFPSRVGRFRVAALPRVALVDELAGPYDAVIAQDVLEHVHDPIGLVAQLTRTVVPGGFALFANAFYPFIHCHLPHTFHLRHTFGWVVAALGLRFEARVEGAAHVLVFRRDSSEPDIARARLRERVSRVIGPALNGLRGVAAGLVRRYHAWAEA